MISDTTHLDFKRTYNRVFEIKMFLSHPLFHPQIWAALDVRGKLCERNGCLEGGKRDSDEGLVSMVQGRQSCPGPLLSQHLVPK